MYDVYRERRLLVMQGLGTIPNLTLNKPEGFLPFNVFFSAQSGYRYSGAVT